MDNNVSLAGSSKTLGLGFYWPWCTSWKTAYITKLNKAGMSSSASYHHLLQTKCIIHNCEKLITTPSIFHFIWTCSLSDINITLQNKIYCDRYMLSPNITEVHNTVDNSAIFKNLLTQELESR